MNNIVKKFKQKRKAANARKWKHNFGGLLKAEEGTKLNNLEGIASGGMQLLSLPLGLSKLSKSADVAKEALKARRKAEANNVDDSSAAAQDYISQLQYINPDAHFGSIDYFAAKNMFEKNARIQAKNIADTNYYRDLYNLNQNLDQQHQDIFNSGMQGLNTIFSSLGNFNFNNKKNNPPSSQVTTT